MTCKDCIHYALCKFMDGEICNHFKDKSRFIELPCKVGDTVYCLINEDNELDSCSKHFCMCKVEDFSFEKRSNEQLLLVHLNFWNTDINPRTDIEFVKEVFGKTVFLTKAEAKLKELNEK